MKSNIMSELKAFFIFLVLINLSYGLTPDSKRSLRCPTNKSGQEVCKEECNESKCFDGKGNLLFLFILKVNNSV